MIVRKLVLAALTGAAVLSAVTASAQYYDPYRRPPPPRYEDYDRPPPDRWDRPRRYDYDRGPPRDYDRGPPRYRDDRYGGMCVTSRGTCQTQPLPRGAPCRCYIEGFGDKRGIIQ